jgi:hypothetical protein
MLLQRKHCRINAPNGVASTGCAGSVNQDLACDWRCPQTNLSCCAPVVDAGSYPQKTGTYSRSAKPHRIGGLFAPGTFAGFRINHGVGHGLVRIALVTADCGVYWIWNAAWTVALTVIFCGRTGGGGGGAGAGARFAFTDSADTMTDSVSDATWLP